MRVRNMLGKGRTGVLDQNLLFYSEKKVLPGLKGREVVEIDSYKL